MPPKISDNTESMNNYPDIVKLKEKYSPQKRIPPPSRGPSESFSKNYRVFATAPKRNAITSDIRNMKGNTSQDFSINSLAPPILRSRNGSPEIGSDDSSGSNGPKRLSSTGGLSPIRRSGSPVRRKYISEIEQELNHSLFKEKVDNNQGVSSDFEKKIKRDKPQQTKRQKVSFNKEVGYNDTFTTSKLNDEKSLHTKRIPSSNLRGYDDDQINDNLPERKQDNENILANSPNKENTVIKFNKLIDDVNSRLKSLEDTQNELLDIFTKIAAEPETIDRINKLQESTMRLQNSMK